MDSYSYNDRFVFANTRHCAQNVWVGLSNSDMATNSVRGYLLCTISVAGPGDLVRIVLLALFKKTNRTLKFLKL